ncbi:MAG TPA: DUF1178 family protein [Accumulibacter sp.]|jgi:hypothetical protein|nr:DUF1178 family protein [Accumulibacter sp.]
MIIFDLVCAHGHRFEGWFQSSEEFERQLADDGVSCPQCGSTAVRRVPSAVHLAPALKPSASSVDRPERMNKPVDGTLATYRQLAAMLLAGCEDVGSRFAEEARKIHYLEAPERPIRGESTAEDYDALRDEGIDVFRLPRLKAGDLH